MRRIVILVVGLALLAAACGGSDDDAGVDTAATTAASSEITTTVAGGDDEGDGTAATTTGAAPAGELPDFSSDFDRVCTTQVGFGGAAAYDPGSGGPHPVIVFRETDDDGTFFESSNTLPDGWLVVQDDNFEDNSDLEVVELVACLDRTATSPNGTVCEFDDDGEKLTLNLVDATYDVIVYEAATGAEVGRTTVEAATTDCPFFVFVDEGQTDYVNTPSDDDLVNALKPFVTP